MLDLVRSHGFMLEEIYSEKGKTTNDFSLAKVILYDIVRQARTSTALSPIDAVKCYDSIAHAIVSLVFQAIGVPLEAFESIQTAIEEMKYFLWTTYGDSKTFSGSTIELKLQGLYQCNGADPAGWAVISITVLCAHKSKVYGGHFVYPISNLTVHLAVLLFVDDTDLIHINLKE